MKWVEFQGQLPVANGTGGMCLGERGSVHALASEVALTYVNEAIFAEEGGTRLPAGKVAYSQPRKAVVSLPSGEFLSEQDGICLNERGGICLNERGRI